jgi:hypothetical protein
MNNNSLYCTSHTFFSLFFTFSFFSVLFFSFFVFFFFFFFSKATVLACQSMIAEEIPNSNTLAFHKVFKTLDKAGTHPFGMIALSQVFNFDSRVFCLFVF